MEAIQLTPAVCAAFTAGLRSWRAGLCSADDAYNDVDYAVETALGAGHDQIIVGPEPEDVARPLLEIFAQLSPYHPNEIRLVLPRPGDPRTVAGTGDFAGAALAAGSGIVVGNLGLAPHAIPRRFVEWRAFRLDRPAAPQLDSVAEAEHDLLLALRSGSEIFNQWSGQRIDPELQRALTRVREGGAVNALPSGYDARSTRLSARAVLVWEIVQLATTPTGASSAWEISAHAAELRKLQQSAEHALMAAINTPFRQGQSTSNYPDSARNT
ncbi:MAG: hypothetical protein HOQ05_04490 [Corynebacteriales bacterium]|nr:hypothetical protein [Mycobacteriales bacterium]